ncbi:uncharacterized protein LOC106176204 [Lingula anatina]|uniref:Uncharacterized protein LOC106176204 n=1 Tax=Lingula anatina TaxID=7574 RepID=A0A1S3JV09_LINAN|nr:uncharacterized protein LOC106176204 [Lingula anatina]|eukprot:XP_013413931.1 uncharacterized protein LOC106176204 [Lingula anatina]
MLIICASLCEIFVAFQHIFGPAEMTKIVPARFSLFLLFFMHNYLHFIVTSSRLRFENTEYELYPEAKSWLEGRKTCSQLGGRLASVKTEEVQNFLVKNVIQAKEHVWIGGFVGKRWFWTDKQEIEWFFWAPGEPNNNGDKEDRLQLFYGYDGHLFNYTWNDNDGSKKCELGVKSKFICRYDKTNCKNATVCHNSKTNHPCIESGSWCYILEGQIAGPNHKRNDQCTERGWTWDASRMYCQKNNGILAKIEDLPTMEKIRSRIQSDKSRYEGNYWIGGMWDRDAQRIWKWVGGGNVSYTNWKSGEPKENSDLKMVCMEMWTRRIDNISEWNDENCQNTYPYICQFDITTYTSPSTGSIDSIVTTPSTSTTGMVPTLLATMPFNATTSTFESKSIDISNPKTAMTPDIRPLEKIAESTSLPTDVVSFGTPASESVMAFKHTTTVRREDVSHPITKGAATVTRSDPFISDMNKTPDFAGLLSNNPSKNTRVSSAPPYKTVAVSQTSTRLPHPTEQETDAEQANLPNKSLQSTTLSSAQTSKLLPEERNTKVPRLQLSEEFTSVAPSNQNGRYKHRSDNGTVPKEVPDWVIAVSTVASAAVACGSCLLLGALYKRKRKKKKIKPDENENKQEASKSWILSI